VLAVAGTSVLAFRKPDTTGEYSFQVIRMDCSKGRKPSSGGMRAGATGFADKASILSETAGARDKRKFFNGLIAWPA
jgi:hypothetical protein